MGREISIDRRRFTKAMCGIGAIAIGGVGLSGCARDDAEQLDGSVTQDAQQGHVEYPEFVNKKPVEAEVDSQSGELKINEDVLVRYSGCLGCYSHCGNHVKIDKGTGRIISVGGNPYHPSSAYPNLANEDSLEEAYKSFSFTDANNGVNPSVCGRGQSTCDSYFQPDRVTTPLKRAGKRGEGKWKIISWDQLISEVTEGGKLFSDIGEDHDVVGFKALHDNTTPMNPQYPDLGPISNQLLMLGGRGDGRTNIAGRFAGAFGTVNSYGHGSS